MRKMNSIFSIWCYSVYEINLNVWERYCKLQIEIVVRFSSTSGSKTFWINCKNLGGGGEQG